MVILGLDIAIWIVLVLYFAGMLLMGWWSKRGIHDREGFLLGGRQFGVGMMVMHAFGAGTHPGDVAGVVSKSVERGASGIWVSWMWMFGTPFYWLIAPVVRRMRCLTMADYFEERFGPAATVLYVIISGLGGTIACASVLLATTRTVQGMMGKAAAGDAWFFGILLVTTAVFVLYSYWGGIIAAIRTDMIQGLMIIALSFIAIPVALQLVGGWASAKETIAAARAAAATAPAAGMAEGQTLSLFDPKYFSLGAVLVLCVTAPFSMMAQPHLISVTSAGRTEWEGRVGFAYGNVLKRICTMGWAILALCWLAYLIREGRDIHHDAAFGDAVRFLLHPALQGLMLACVLAAAMSTGDALQVTVSGLVSENVYRRRVRPHADEQHYVHVTRLVGLGVIAGAVLFAIAMRASVVESILTYFRVTATIGIAVAMGILWPRMNSVGVFASTIAAAAVLLLLKHVLPAYEVAVPALVQNGAPLVTAVVFGVAGSLLTAPPNRRAIEEFLKKIYTPIGQEERLTLPLDEAVPPSQRWTTAGGLFLVKPSTQSWLGFLVTLVICIALVGVMTLLLL